MRLQSYGRVVSTLGMYLSSNADATDWPAYYNLHPLYVDKNGTGAYNVSDPAEVARVLGGEACMWGEGVDATNLFGMVWPSLTQVAERLWSEPRNGLDLLSGRRRRLRLHRCRLLSRKLPLAPMAAIYLPDASHASFATWREWSWCPGDEAAFEYEGL